MDKDTVVYSFNAILAQQNKNWTRDTHKNLHKSQKHCASSKKSAIKRLISFIY